MREISEYLGAAMRRAHYEMIDVLEPFYGEIRECQGVWATGKTLEECRQTLLETLEAWLVLSLQRSLPIPTGEAVRGLSLEAHDSSFTYLDLYRDPNAYCDLDSFAGPSVMGGPMNANDSRVNEIGSGPDYWMKAARADARFAGISEPDVVFQWHGETFDLPQPPRVVGSKSTPPQIAGEQGKTAIHP